MPSVIILLSSRRPLGLKWSRPLNGIDEPSWDNEFNDERCIVKVSNADIG
jgi:hypothetical protein